MRDTLGAAQQVRYVYTRYQDAVPFFVENAPDPRRRDRRERASSRAGRPRAGASSRKSRPVPIKHMLASASLTAEQVQKVREYLVGLDATEDGRKKLEPIKYEGFAAYDEGGDAGDRQVARPLIHAPFLRTFSSRSMHLHILGICGTFMGGLAALAREAGHRVTGCDANVYPPMSDQLARPRHRADRGLRRRRSWRSTPDLFVVGNVVTRGNR